MSPQNLREARTKLIASSPSLSLSKLPFSSKILYFRLEEVAIVLPTPESARGGIRDVYSELYI